MTTHVDDLVRRQAAILHEINNLDSAEQESLANTVTRGDDKARRLLRGLICTGNVTTRNDLEILFSSTSVKEGVIPALPGLFLIDLKPLPNGTFDCKCILKTPVIAWKVDRHDYVSPLIPGLPIGDRWAVLTPDGFVITDQFTNLYGDLPLTLQDWIKSEIEWAEDPMSLKCDFVTSSQRLLNHSGPLARAVWRMMATRCDWAGPAEEMLFLLSRFRDNATDWPTGPAALVAALTELEPVFAEADASTAAIEETGLAPQIAGHLRARMVTRLAPRLPHPLARSSGQGSANDRTARKSNRRHEQRKSDRVAYP